MKKKSRVEEFDELRDMVEKQIQALSGRGVNEVIPRFFEGFQEDLWDKQKEVLRRLEHLHDVRWSGMWEVQTPHDGWKFVFYDEMGDVFYYVMSIKED